LCLYLDITTIIRWPFERGDCCNKAIHQNILSHGSVKKVFCALLDLMFTTGSGKSYTMMGASQDEALKGIIPRLCDNMFARIADVSRSSGCGSCRPHKPHLSFFAELRLPANI